MEETEPVTRASGGARVQIRQIFYAADSAERAVSLRIGGGPLVDAQRRTTTDEP